MRRHSRSLYHILFNTYKKNPNFLLFTLSLYTQKPPNFPKISQIFSLLSSMASQSEATAATEAAQSLLERVINSRNRDLSLFIPFILGLTGSDPDETRVESGESDTDPVENSENRSSPDESTRRERIILINPVTQGMVVIEGTGLDGIGFDSLFRGKGGQPPASKASVEAIPRVEIREGEEGECVICLEEFGVGSFLKKMPCQHGFHEECIEKWLGIHGSCPVCRYKMPVDEEKEGRESGGDGDGVGVRVDRQIWVSFSVRRSDGRRRRTDDDSDDDHGEDDDRSESEDQTVENESDEMES